MSEPLSNPHLYLPHFTSALRFDDMDADATINLFTHALDPSRNYADLNRRIDSYADKADVIVFQNAEGIDLAKMLSSIPSMSVFQSGALALAVRESPTRTFQGITGNGQTLSGLLIIQGYKPVTIGTATTGDAATTIEHAGLVAIGGPWTASISGTQHAGSLVGSDNWYVSRAITVGRAWVGALTLTGNRPTAIKVSIPRDAKAVPNTPGTKPNHEGGNKPVIKEQPKVTDKHDEFGVMSINFHVGIGVNEQFFNLVKHTNPGVIFGQECIPAAFGRLRKGLGRDYHILPSLAFAVGREAGQTPVLLRKDLWTLVSQSNRLVSPWRGGGDHGRLWPTRYATQGMAKHRATNHVVKFRSFHAWVRGDAAAMEGRSKQFKSLADFCKTGDKVIVGGDFNAAPEQVLNLYLRASNMRLSAAHTPDALFTRGVAVLNAQYLDNPSHEGTHRVILARMSV